MRVTKAVVSYSHVNNDIYHGPEHEITTRSAKENDYATLESLGRSSFLDP